VSLYSSFVHVRPSSLFTSQLSAPLETSPTRTGPWSSRRMRGEPESPGHGPPSSRPVAHSFPGAACAAHSLQSETRICKPFKEPRNRFPTWKAGTTTLFDVTARKATKAGGIDSLESISGLLKRLKIPAQGVTKRCRLSLLTNSALVYESQLPMRGRSCGVSPIEYSCAHHMTWSPNKLLRSTSIFNLYVCNTNISRLQYE
jgi:hypothetical protein